MKSLRTILQQAIYGIAVVFLLVTFFASAFFSIENARNFNLQSQTNSHEVLSELIKPALAISDFLEVQRLMGLVSNKNTVFAVFTHNGDILLSDFTYRNMISALGNFTNPPRCNQISEQTHLIDGRRWTSFCNEIQNKESSSETGLTKELLISLVEIPALHISFLDFLKLAGVLGFTLVVCIMLLRALITNKLLAPIDQLVKAVKERESLKDIEEIKGIDVYESPKELNDLRISFNGLISVIQKNYQDRQEIRTSLALAQLAQQVAHDIRSPLAALNMSIQNVNHLPEDVRLIIRQSLSRIRDIANTLIETNKKTQTQNEVLITKVLVASLLESLISEKRIQFQKKDGTAIELILPPESYGQFISVNPQEFKRALSNLGNNAVEAINETGEVIVSVSKIDNYSLITITDNGCGISTETLKKIGTRGLSIDKQSTLNAGMGLGLHHAITTVEKCGGILAVDSLQGKGTTVSIRLPLVAPPPWFHPQIKLQGILNVVIFDDDSAIHTAWESRLSKVYPEEYKFNLFHIYSPNSLRSWVIQNVDLIDSTLFLMDFEILGFSENGLDLIEELGLQAKATLVTSHYEEHGIQARCERLGIGIVPKSMAWIVPIC